MTTRSKHLCSSSRRLRMTLLSVNKFIEGQFMSRPVKQITATLALASALSALLLVAQDVRMSRADALLTVELDRNEIVGRLVTHWHGGIRFFAQQSLRFPTNRPQCCCRTSVNQSSRERYADSFHKASASAARYRALSGSDKAYAAIAWACRSSPSNDHSSSSAAIR